MFGRLAESVRRGGFEIQEKNGHDDSNEAQKSDHSNYYETGRDAGRLRYGSAAHLFIRHDDAPRASPLRVRSGARATREQLLKRRSPRGPSLDGRRMGPAARKNANLCPA